MNYRQSKKMFEQKVYGLKDNDYIIMEYDMDKVNPQILDFICDMLYKELKKDNVIMIPNAISIKSVDKKYVKQIRDKLSELLGD